jgi:hypothetical protein
MENGEAMKGYRLNLQEEFGKGEAKRPDRPDNAIWKVPKVISCNNLGIAPIRPHRIATGLTPPRSRPGPRWLCKILFDAVQTVAANQD